MDRTLVVVNALAALGTGALMAWAAQGPPSDVFAVLMYGWAVLPYLLLALVPAIARRMRPGVGALPALVVTLLAVAFAGWVYYEAFFVSIDAQSALVLLFVPAFQLAAPLVALLATTFLPLRHRVA